MDEVRRAALWNLSAGIASPAGLFVDKAIAIAVEMLVEGDDRSEVLAVAVLQPGTSQAEAIDPVVKMLTILGIEVVQPVSSDAHTTHLMFKAFANGGLSIEQFEDFWWPSLVSSDQQTDIQRRITRLFDQRDNESNVVGRAALVNEIRRQLLIEANTELPTDRSGE